MRDRCILLIACVGILVLLSACGGGNTPPPTPNPVPTITSITPASETVGGAGFSLTVNGTNFLSSSVVNFNGSAKATTFVNSTQLTATITAADIAGIGTPTVSVTNPAPGGGTSGSLPFAVTPVLVKLSTDTFANALSQHATEVEPDTFAFGSTIVTAFQVGRSYVGGAAAIGYATSTDGGTTWTNGLLPDITTFQGGATFNCVSDPAVAYDAAHGQWIISSLALQQDANGNLVADQVFVSRSLDGLSWGNPIAVNPLTQDQNAFYDKEWIVCDDTSTSPFYGNCYAQWRWDNGPFWSSTSSDGGLTWQAPLNTTDVVHGGGSQPLVQPNGTVIATLGDRGGTAQVAFMSTDGGASWSATTVISTVADHTEAGNLRSNIVASAQMDGAGTVYVVWQDCSFRTNCSSNDIVLSTSSDGVTWTPPSRVPIDPLTSTVDHFIPGIAVDRATSGATAHLTLTYYYYPVSNCGSSCDLYVGFVSSEDGGQTWTAPIQLAGPMQLDWLPNTSAGTMVGDYISGSYVNGKPFAVFAVANANSGSVFDEAMYTTAQPMLSPAGALRFSSAGEKPVPNAKSDHKPRKIPPRRSSRRS